MQLFASCGRIQSLPQSICTRHLKKRTSRECFSSRSVALPRREVDWQKWRELLAFSEKACIARFQPAGIQDYPRWSP